MTTKKEPLKPIVGIRWEDVPKPIAFIYGHTWEVSDMIGTSSMMKKILTLTDELQKTYNDLVKEKISDIQMITKRDQIIKKYCTYVCPR